jgi:hypothetical protein
MLWKQAEMGVAKISVLKNGIGNHVVPQALEIQN